MIEDFECRCNMEHHEWEKMTINLFTSNHNNSACVEIEVHDGCGRDGNNSRITLTSDELTDIAQKMARYMEAYNTMEGKRDADITNR